MVVLGGSGSSTPELFDALGDWPGGLGRRPLLEVVLVGRSAGKLEVVAEACRRRVIAGGAPIEVITSTDRRAALSNAAVVVNQVRIGGYAARAFDESFPWKSGLPGEETMGPGGFANACRTVPALAETWVDIAGVAPEALVINLTNPAGIVQTAAHRLHPQLRVVSVCDSPMPMLAAIAERLGRPLAQVRSRYLGMNHLGWYVPESGEELATLSDLAQGMEPALVALHQALPSPYVRYYVHPDRILAAQRGHETRAEVLQKLDQTLLAGYGADASDLPRRGAVVWYRMAVLALLDAWLNGTEEPVLAATRNGGRISWLPDDAVIELTHDAPRAGALVARPPVALPPLPSAFLAAHAWYEVMAAGAALSGERTACLRALIANPMVGSYDQAERLVDVIESRAATHAQG